MADILQEKSYNFALRIVKLSEFLHAEKREFVLSKKILDSGTNIGLLIEEGKQRREPHRLYSKIFDRQ